MPIRSVRLKAARLDVTFRTSYVRRVNLSQTLVVQVVPGRGHASGATNQIARDVVVTIILCVDPGGTSDRVFDLESVVRETIEASHSIGLIQVSERVAEVVQFGVNRRSDFVEAGDHRENRDCQNQHKLGTEDDTEFVIVQRL